MTIGESSAQRLDIELIEISTLLDGIEAVQFLLALSAQFKWQVHHLNIKSTFLNEEISEEIYVRQSEGFEKPEKEELVYKLNKALYELKQATRS